VRKNGLILHGSKSAPQLEAEREGATSGRNMSA
jgi:hypothetical protein